MNERCDSPWDKDFVPDSSKYEKNWIKALQEETLHIQQKTFTKWMNHFLQKVSQKWFCISEEYSSDSRLEFYQIVDLWSNETQLDNQLDQFQSFVIIFKND